MAETSTKIVSLSNLQSYDTLIKKYVNDADAVIDAKSIKAVKVNGDNIEFYKSTDESAAPAYTVAIASSDVTAIKEALGSGFNKDNTVADAINAINNETTGILATAKGYTDTEVKKVTDSIGTVPADSTVIDEIAKAKKAGDDAQTTIDGYKTTNDARVKAVEDNIDTIETTIGDMTAVKTTAKTVAGAVDELKDAIDASGTAGKVTIENASTPTEGYLKTYVVKQGTEEVGKIDIPKDLVVESGEIVIDPEGQAAGTYIKLVIANQEEPIYINVKDLVDIYTAAGDATQVQIAISDTNVVSATLVAGGVGTTELADGAVTTAKIADANVTKAKLAQDVQDALDAADSALQASDIVTGATNGTISVDGTDVAVKGLEDAAFTKVETINATAKGYADTAEANAKKYADDLYEVATTQDINNLFQDQVVVGE